MRTLALAPSPVDAAARGSRLVVDLLIAALSDVADEQFAGEADPRITRVGRIIRKLRIDELPQFFNVLKGEMSLIGPRAYMPSEASKMGDYTATILRIRPGLTGWWQVTGRHETTFEQRLRMDEYYISNWSLWMDTYILLKTVWVILSGRGV